MDTARARRGPSRVVLVAVAIVAGLLLALGIDVVRSGSAGAWFMRHRLAPPYAAAGHRVDIGGRSLYLDCRGTGRPTVVLEAGSGSDSGAWTAVHDELARSARTCAYDRAGRGRSDPAPVRTLAGAGDDLRALLAAAGEPGPYVLVGHSLGGAVARVFAASHRSELAGLVLVDPFSPDIQETRIHPLLGPLRAEYEATLDGLRAYVSAVDSLDWPSSEIELRGSTLAGLPIEVLEAPRYEPRLDANTNAAIADARRAGYEALSPGRVTQTTAWGAGHDIQVDRPDLVIAAARRLVDLAR